LPVSALILLQSGVKSVMFVRTPWSVAIMAGVRVIAPPSTAAAAFFGGILCEVEVTVNMWKVPG
jgi:hypothetical protein